MKHAELMEYSKDSLVNTILDYQDQIIELKKQLKGKEILKENNKELNIKLEKYKDLAYQILEENGETFGY